MLHDAFGREICYIRVSVTDRCNLRCFYCMPEEGVPFIPHPEILRFEEIALFVKVAAGLGIRSVRLTGGEPLVRKDLHRLVASLRGINGLDDLSLTTNGILLKEQAELLREAGLGRVNIGLPSLDRETYHRLTRQDGLDQAQAGIRKALEIGFRPVKINVVVLRGINEDLVPFLELTRDLPVEVRFIEYMPIGALDQDQYFLSASSIERQLRRLGPLEDAPKPAGQGPAQRYWRIPGAPGRIAILAPMSEHFCQACNRLRLTSDGHLRLCLFSEREIDLKPALRPLPDEAQIAQLLDQALREKPMTMAPQLVAGHRQMAQIGG